MNTLRAMVLEKDKSFQAAQKAFEAQSLYHMEGECYKRPHFADQPEAFRPWLERRNLCFVAESADFDLLFSEELAPKLAEDFRLLEPLYQFLLQVSLREISENGGKPGVR